jgi:cytochrome oxidase assembly protein ShyY1
MSEYLQIPFDNEIYLEATNNGPSGYPIGNQTRIYLRNNHLQYALTWMFLSFGLIGVFLFSNFKIIKK